MSPFKLQSRFSKSNYLPVFCLAGVLQSCGKQFTHNMGTNRLDDAYANSTEPTDSTEPTTPALKTDTLEKAIQEGDEQAVENLLQAYTTIQQLAEAGIYPLIHHAMSEGKVEIMTMLINKILDIDKHNHVDLGIQGTIIEKLFKDILQYKGSNRDEQATLAGHLLTILFTTYTKKELARMDTRSLMKEAVYHGDIRLISRLQLGGIDIDATDSQGNTLLHDAARTKEGDIQVIKTLLGVGANIEAKNNDTSTPLLVAVSNGNIGIVQALINANANLEAKDDKSRTPIHHAAANGRVDMVQAFLDANANKEAVDEEGQTPLHWAVLGNSTLVIENLLRAGAHIEAKSNWENTPLLIAASVGYTEVFQLLLDKHAQIDAKNKDGDNALHCAARNGHDAVITFLTQKLNKNEKMKNQMMNAKNQNGETPLVLSSQESHDNATTTLLKNCAHIGPKVMSTLVGRCGSGNETIDQQRWAPFLDAKNRENCTTVRSSANRNSFFLHNMVKGALGYIEAGAQSVSLPYDTINNILLFMPYLFGKESQEKVREIQQQDAPSIVDELASQVDDAFKTAEQKGWK